MHASLNTPGGPAPWRQWLVHRGLLPMTVAALVLVAVLAVLHLRALSAEAYTIARIQAVRLAAAASSNGEDDAIRDALSRTLSRSAPTDRVILHRYVGPDLQVDSGRTMHASRALHVRVATPLGEMETLSDGSTVRERQLSGLLMMLMLAGGIVALHFACLRLIVRDLVQPVETMRQHIETELGELRARHEASLAGAFRQRMHEIARQTRFIEQVGDHFRQPLQALSLFVGGMEPGSDLRARAVQSQMQANVARLNELLDGLLDLARFDAGAVEPVMAEVVAADLYVRERSTIGNDAGRLNTSVRWRGGRLAIRTDASLMAELLHRLVANAVISTPHGRVLVAMRRRGSAVRLEVRDNGMGLDPRQAERIFEDFTRLPGHPGYGLGLAVARRIAEHLGGTIGVRSSPGRGTLFWVQLEDAAVMPQRSGAATAHHALP